MLSNALTQNTDLDNMDHRAVMKLEKVEEANEKFEKSYVLALDYLSCALFAELFFDFERDWLNRSIESPIQGEINMLLSQLPLYAAALTDAYSFARLLLICADKIVIRYLILIRDSGMSYLIDFDEYMLQRLVIDTKLIQKAFADIAKSCGCEKYLCLIELRLQRLDDMCTLIIAQCEGELFKITLRKLTEEGMCKRNESLAFANFMRACLKLRKISHTGSLTVSDMVATSLRSLESVYERPVVNLVCPSHHSFFISILITEYCL
jgi:hypothetical protein